MDYTVKLEYKINIISLLGGSIYILYIMQGVLIL